MEKMNLFGSLATIVFFFSCSTSNMAVAKEENQFPATAIVKTVGNIEVMVDPNVELMVVIQRLAGMKPYMPSMDVPYLARIDEYFEPYKYSTAVRMLRNSSIAYHLPSEFGMYLTSDDSDFIMKPENEKFVVSIGPAKKLTYYCLPTLREAVREFRIESKFDQFFLSNAAEYEELIKKHVRILETVKIEPWLKDFYGIERKGHVCLYVTKVSGNYGISFVDPEGEMIPHAVVLDKPSADETLYLISHEFSHPMTHGIIDELYEDARIRRIFDDLYLKDATFYSSIGYGNGFSVLGETINQACANKFNERIFPEKTMQWFLSREVESRKMVYVPAITKFLDNYQGNKDKYGNLESFVPELKEFLTALE